ncbi:hypothetical protein KSP39_PZI009842 [Platanthera zijinensis]|uniref:Uncharacterized protein n=1 Tax=Platanthera zijinensis TaxID=2320716 RepID=A0AAP0BI97_9ASPA
MLPCFEQGVKIVFQVGLALLTLCQVDLVKLAFEKLIHALRNFPEDAMDPEKLLPLAFSFKVTKRLEELKQEYDKRNGVSSSQPSSSSKQLKSLKSTPCAAKATND